MLSIRLFLFSFLFLALVVSADSQDSTRLVTSFDVDLVGKHVPLIYSNRDCVNCDRFVEKSNPINHFAVYNKLNLNLELNQKHRFKLGVLAEQRGFSFGNANRNTLIVIPWIHIESRDTVTLFGHRLQHELVAGDLWQEDVDDILRFYNIDYQGVYTKLGKDNWRLGFFVISDLSQGIGLELGELHRLSFESRSADSKVFVALGHNLLRFGAHSRRRDFNVTLLGKKKFSSVEMSFQSDLRLNADLGLSPALALVMDHVTPKLNVRAALRYYGAAYNNGYENDRLVYGSRLYPLKNYYRNISQWALYSDRQGSALLGLELTGQRTTQLTEKISFHRLVDMNVIYDFTNNTLELLPAYEFTFHFYSLDNLRFEAGVTNKHMRLANHFQTSALSVLPYFTYGFKLSMESLRKSSLAGPVSRRL